MPPTPLTDLATAAQRALAGGLDMACLLDERGRMIKTSCVLPALTLLAPGAVRGRR